MKRRDRTGASWSEKPPDRGQTIIDYALGIGAVLVAIIGLFAFVQGTVFESYTTPVSGDERATVDRAANFLVENFSTEPGSNVLRTDLDSTADSGTLDAFLSNGGERLGNLKQRIGANVVDGPEPALNVTLVNASSLTRDTPLPGVIGSGSAQSWGQAYLNQSGAVSTVRVVGVTNDSAGRCTPVCWLIVRAW